jgi:hypothetical protein
MTSGKRRQTPVSLRFEKRSSIAATALILPPASRLLLSFPHGISGGVNALWEYAARSTYQGHTVVVTASFASKLACAAAATRAAPTCGTGLAPPYCPAQRWSPIVACCLSETRYRWNTAWQADSAAHPGCQDLGRHRGSAKPGVYSDSSANRIADSAYE